MMRLFPRVPRFSQLVVIAASAMGALTALLLSSTGAFASAAPVTPNYYPTSYCLYANVANTDPGGFYNNQFPIVVRQGNGCFTPNSGATPPQGLQYKVSSSCPGIGDPVRYGYLPYAPMQPNRPVGLNGWVQGHCILCDVRDHRIVDFPQFTLTITLLGIDGVYGGRNGQINYQQPLGMTTDSSGNPVLAQGFMANLAGDPGSLHC